MLSSGSPEHKSRIFAHSFARWRRREQEYKAWRERDDLYWSFIAKTENAIASTSGPLQSYLDSSHHLTPNQTVRTLAAHAIADLRMEGPEQGHIAIEVIKEPGRSMVKESKEICDDCPGEHSVIVKITFNLVHPLTNLWSHTGVPPEDVLQEGISVLADAAVLLAFELNKDPNSVLYRSELPK